MTAPHNVDQGDEVYFHHQEGPKSGKVLAVGKHGATVDADGRRHSVHWEHMLGHKKRMIHRMGIVDRGEDGAILEDDKGRRRFIAGELPEDTSGYLEPIAKLEPVEPDELITRQIESAMQGKDRYHVLAGELPDEATVLVTESTDGAPELLRALEEMGLTAQYQAVPQASVQAGEESSGVLLAFAPEPEQKQDLINAVAHHQRQARGALESEDITVFGDKSVQGMTQVGLSKQSSHGRTVLSVEQVGAAGTVPVSMTGGVLELDTDGNDMAKALLFFKASIGN